MNKKTKALTMSLGLMLGSTTLAYAEEFTFAIGYPPGSLHSNAAEAFKSYAMENGGLDIEVFPTSLLGISQIPEGIRDGIVDMGFNAHALFSAEYPNSNLPADLNILASAKNDPNQVMLAPAAMSGAITEYIMLNCPECQKEFEDQGQIYLSGQSSASYALQCIDPITSLDDIKGKQIRTPSGYWSRWAEGVGAVSVFMSANEVFTALSQGAVDCVAMSPAELISLRLIDVVKNVTIGAPQGVFSGMGVVNISLDKWRSLSTEDRKSLMGAAFFLNAKLTYELASSSQLGLDEAKAQNIPILTPDEDLAAATVKMGEANREQVMKQYVEVSNLTDIDAKAETIDGLVEKWLGLMNGVTSMEDMQRIYDEEIFAKVDIETYGMN